MIETRCWTVYGRIRAGVDGQGLVQFRGLHLDRAPSLDMANSFVEDAITGHGQGAVDCVIVELRYGEDRHGFRSVVRRVGQGKSWWE